MRYARRVPKTFTAVALLVREYDEAIDWFTRVLRFTLREDTPLSPDKRWVRVAAEGGSELLLARAATPEQQAAVGRQAGGRVGWFLHTDDLDAEVAHLRRHGVHFVGTPRDEVHGRVVGFHDLYGKPWDLVEPAPPT
jgi:catechol 2,3-dioxygenase-like lactoylglutathione lyase family enzyme